MEKINPNYVEIAESGLFSADWYLDQYQDVAAAGQDPLEHYLLYGADEGRDPGPGFSTAGYLSHYKDVAIDGINPLLHYIRYGQNEGRLPKPKLDPQSIKRPYRNFAEYLTYSMLDPLVKAPFSMVDLDNFKFTEQVTRWLCLKQKECMVPPLVSVIMPVRDRAELAGDAIRSVLAQSYANFELIVIDDGSRDDTVSVVRSFTDGRIRLLLNRTSTGVSRARNLGLEAAQGELIAYLDSDNTWRQDFLCAMVGVFQVRSDADAAYGGQYLYQGHESEPFAVRFGSYNFSLLRNNNYIDLNCFVHRQDILKKIENGFCEKIKRLVDWELILRISRVGQIYSVPILQSNYFFGKAENTIMITEELDPARPYIIGKMEYDRKNWMQKCDNQLTKKVAVIVLAHAELEYIDVYMGALTDRLRNPLVQFVVVGTTGASSLQAWKGLEVQTIVIDPGGDNFYAIGQAVRLVDSDCDLLVLDSAAGCKPDTLPLLQKAAYACSSIAMTVPQHVLPGGDPTINMHVPYAFNDVSCDVTLSNYHSNIETLTLLHSGGAVNLNFTSFFCVYLKRDIWDLCGAFDTRQDKVLSERDVCDFIRHVLEKRLVYIPDAIVLHGVSS